MGDAARFHAACTGEAFSDLNTPEEDVAWRDLEMSTVKAMLVAWLQS
jgi:hypothetical protein